MEELNFIELRSEFENRARKNLSELFINSPIPPNEILDNLSVYQSRQALSRSLFIDDLYKQILDVNGVVMEFGVRWGNNLGLFEALRGIYEPYNYSRKIIGFDTFEGFPTVHEKDGENKIIKKGSYSVTDKYEEHLKSVLENKEQLSPLNHINKFQIVKGNAIETLEQYLIEHPETIISLAYFDFDIYEPTKRCLELIKDYITKGSIIAFDELNYPEFPGETIALREVIGLDKYRIKRSKYASIPSYIVIE